MKANGLMIKLTEKELTYTWTAQNTSVNGLMINNMVTVWKLGQIMLVTKEIMNMEKNMEQEHLNGRIPRCS